MYIKLENSFKRETENRIALFELSALQHKNQLQLEQYQSGHGLVAEVRQVEISLLLKSLEGNGLAI